VTFHIGDTVTFTNTADNIADRLDGQDGRVIHIDSLEMVVDVPDSYVLLRDTSGIELADCPHEGDQ
jgi:hypothetical protein